MHAALKLVGERLPRVQEETALLLERDELFRELCDEYVICAQAATRFAGSAQVNGPVHKEYEFLRLRLEGELLRYLAEHPEA